IGRSFRGPRGRVIPGGIEHTAPLARGSSGGPIVDADGRLLGITTLALGGGLLLAPPRGPGAARGGGPPERGPGATAAAARHRGGPRTRRSADAPGGRAAGARRRAGPSGGARE